MDNNNKKSIKTKILAVLFASIFITTATLGFVSFGFSKRRLAAMLGDSIKGIAATAASFIKSEDILLITRNSGIIKDKRLTAFYRNLYEDTHANAALKVEPSEEMLAAEAVALYMHNKNLLSGIKKMNNIDSPINIYIPQDSKLKMVMTSDVLLTDAVYTLRPEAEAALSSLSPRATRIYRDKDGTWISAYSPIIPADASRPAAIIEINLKIDSYMERLEEEFWIIVVVCLVVMLASGLIGFNLVNRISKSVITLDAVAAELEKGNYAAPIKVESDDEIGHLARTFDGLRRSIRNKIEELRLSVVREKRAHLESIVALTNAIEMRDPYTKEHLNRVEKYALLIAKKIKLPKNDMIKLKYSCFLHDIGKIYIDNEQLQRSKLSDKDVEEIRKHPQMGAKIIEGIKFLVDVREAVLYHQERYDGKGYPEGLKGVHIPLMARIIAVADALDAMTTDRPYKPKISFKKAMEELRRNSGTQFDPKIADALLSYKDKISEIARKHFEYPFID
jgi:putative nucleotidyltransferase with HDIG domain